MGKCRGAICCARYRQREITTGKEHQRNDTTDRSAHGPSPSLPDDSGVAGVESAAPIREADAEVDGGKAYAVSRMLKGVARHRTPGGKRRDRD